MAGGSPETRTQQASYEQFQQFVKRATAEVVSQINQNGLQIFKNTLRDMHMASEYYSDSPTLVELGERNHVGRVRAGEAVRGAVIYLRDHCSDQVRALFPQNGVPRRPVRQGTRERLSKAAGGKSIFIAEHAREKPVVQVLQELGEPRIRWERRRRVLRNWDPQVEVPYLHSEIVRGIELAREFEKMKTYTGPDRNKKLQGLMDRVRYSFYRRHNHGGNPFFISFCSLARDASLKVPRNPDAEGRLRDALDLYDIPNGKATVRTKQGLHRYHFIFTPDRKRGLEAFGSIKPQRRRRRR